MINTAKSRVLEEISCCFFKVEKKQNNDGRWGYAKFMCVCEKGYRVSLIGCRNCVNNNKNKIGNIE
jgi:hypothetical protein